MTKKLTIDMIVKARNRLESHKQDKTTLKEFQEQINEVNKFMKGFDNGNSKSK